jgi:MFS family permease
MTEFSDSSSDRSGGIEDERRPLLAGELSAVDRPSSRNSTLHSQEIGHPGGGKEQNGRIPWLQLIILCLARMMDPVVYGSIFPYIAAMVHRNTGLPVSDVGFYSGLIESVFAIVQTVMLVVWSWLSDKMGRKKALIISLLGTAIGSSLFGMATTLWQMVLFRCVAGVFTASNLITRTMVAECVPSKVQPQAFSWLVFAANAGNFVGPMIGGALADPATQYPNLFGSSKWFIRNPYALAGISVGVISVGIGILSAFWLKETQQAKEDASVDENTPPPAGGLKVLVTSPGVPVTFGVYVYAKFLAMATSAILPVYLYTPAGLGGMQLSTTQISIYMAVQGGSQVLWLLLAFPILNIRLGTKPLLSAIATFWPLVFAGYVVMNAMLRTADAALHQLLWVAIAPVMVIVGSAVIMSQTSIQLAINDVSPTSDYLAMINALALVGNNVVRAVTPGASSAIFALGVKNGILKGHLAWAILIILSIQFRVLVQWLPNITTDV